MTELGRLINKDLFYKLYTERWFLQAVPYRLATERPSYLFFTWEENRFQNRFTIISLYVKVPAHFDLTRDKNICFCFRKYSRNRSPTRQSACCLCFDTFVLLITLFCYFIGKTQMKFHARSFSFR